MQLNEDEDRNLSISLKAAFYPEGGVWGILAPRKGSRRLLGSLWRASGTWFGAALQFALKET